MVITQIIVINARYIDNSLDVYEKISEQTGYLALIKENNRLIDALLSIRDEIDFDIADTWKNPSPSYKGCEPLRTSKHSVHCD